MSIPTFTCYLILSFLCAAVNVAPTVSHFAQGHSGPASFGIWVILLNTCAFINGVMWKEDAMNRAPVFCDVTAKLNLVGPVGLLISNWCIIQHLAKILTASKSVECRKASKKRMIRDYLLSFGLPAMIALASLIFQFARYQVNRLVGCSHVSALTWPTMFLFLIWPPIICGVSCAYSAYVLYWLIRQHTNLRALVTKSRNPLNMKRFVRMCVLAATYLCISAPVTIFGTLATVSDIGPYVPWTSWDALHDKDNQLSAIRQNPLYQLKARDWVPITAGLVVFFVFAFANESLTIYKALFRQVHANLAPLKLKSGSDRKSHDLQVGLTYGKQAKYASRRLISTSSS
ncbi:mating type STE3 pheromone receptor [Melampsora americana]|nr:mating type STE3 pheromone receptor [Melampsora americana]